MLDFLSIGYRGKRYVGAVWSGGVASVDPDGPYARPTNARWFFTYEGASVADFEADTDDTEESVRAQLIAILQAQPV